MVERKGYGVPFEGRCTKDVGETGQQVQLIEDANDLLGWGGCHEDEHLTAQVVSQVVGNSRDPWRVDDCVRYVFGELYTGPVNGRGVRWHIGPFQVEGDLVIPRYATVRLVVSLDAVADLGACTTNKPSKTLSLCLNRVFYHAVEVPKYKTGILKEFGNLSLAEIPSAGMRAIHFGRGDRCQGRTQLVSTESA